jgi:hypothetical protein
MRENRTSGSMRGRRKRTVQHRACVLLYRRPRTLLAALSAARNQRPAAGFSHLHSGLNSVKSRGLGQSSIFKE